MKIIVSLTSWTKRIDQAHLTIESILNQTRKPDLVELNLDTENFPNERADLPETLTSLEDRGLIKIYFYHIDLHCWSKLINTWRRHRGEEYMSVTLDDDYTYPPNYLEEIEKNYQNADWGSTQHPKLTGGQFMVYKSSLIERIIDKISDELVLNCPLDDHVLFHVIHTVKNTRGPVIDSVPQCRGVGWSWRRNYYKDKDPSTLSQGEYPYESFLRERDYMRAHNIAP